MAEMTEVEAGVALVAEMNENATLRAENAALRAQLQTVTAERDTLLENLASLAVRESEPEPEPEPEAKAEPREPGWTEEALACLRAAVAEGLKYSQCAERLNLAGFTQKSGKPFTTYTVYRLKHYLTQSLFPFQTSKI